MNDRLEVLGTLAGSCVIERIDDGTYRLGGESICPALVKALESDGHIRETRRPTITGSSATGRFVITDLGKRFVFIMRGRAA